MSEHDLQSEIIEPLLRKLSFRNVYVNSGPNERGADLIASKDDDVEPLMLYSIQIKKFKPSAKVGSNSSFGRLLDQLRQALQEPVMDPETNERRCCDRCWFVTPYPVPPRIREAFQQRLREPLFRILKIIDGPKLVDLIQKHLPDAVMIFSADVRYRLNVARDANKIVEAPVAFETAELQLDQMYIDVSLGSGDASLEVLAGQHIRSKGECIIAARRSELNHLSTQYTRWLGVQLPADEIASNQQGNSRIIAVGGEIEKDVRTLLRKKLELIYERWASAEIDSEIREQLEAIALGTAVMPGAIEAAIKGKLVRSDEKREMDLGAELRANLSNTLAGLALPDYLWEYMQAYVRAEMPVDANWRVDQAHIRQLLIEMSSGTSAIPDALQGLLRERLQSDPNTANHDVSEQRLRLEIGQIVERLTIPEYLRLPLKKALQQEHTRRKSDALDQRINDEVARIKSGAEPTVSVGEVPKIWSVNIDGLIASVRTKVREYVHRSLPKLRKASTSSAECTQVVTDGRRLRRDIDELAKVFLIQQFWPSLLPEKSQAAKEGAFSLPASTLLKINHCIYVTGAPGSGKTTLLRRLTQLMATSDRPPLPLLVPLAIVGRQDLITACAHQMALQGFTDLNRTEVAKRVEQGNVRLCLDGLDEAGSDAERIMKEIDCLVSSRPNSNVILSSRNTFGSLQWERAFTVRLKPFSDQQLESFVAKWFSSEPTSQSKLLIWFNENPTMRQIARTPLIAALLCSLFRLQTDMPSTELELYERRFELLLGRWERAKRIVPLSTGSRRQYLHFLTALAVDLHRKEDRSISEADAVRFAEPFSTPKFYATPQALIRDCEKRGLLERDDERRLTFGHLTYQEYLAGEWFAQHNPTGFIWSRLLTPWWAKVLEFYAARQLDITPLVREGLKYRGEQVSLERLSILVNLAPLTSKKVFEQFRALPRSGMAGFRWAAPAPSLEA